MSKWLYPGLALGWAVSMVYEWFHCGGRLIQYVAWAFMVGTVLLGLFVRSCMREVNIEKEPPAMLWFLLAAAVCALFFKVGLGQAEYMNPPHVLALPMYPIMFLDFLAVGCYTWWKKRQKG